MTRKFYFLIMIVMMACVGCQWHLRADSTQKKSHEISIERLDRLERLYLTTADFAALQQMKMSYPKETRMLIEDVLRLGRVDEPDINTRFWVFFQDSTLQAIMTEVDRQYEDMSDVEEELTSAFKRLKKLQPDVTVPRIYTQVGSLDQSIVVSDTILGISLDKYLGSDYPVYQKYGYADDQRRVMDRRYIVADCIAFYLFSLYPSTSLEREDHAARVKYVVNRVVDRQVFSDPCVTAVQRMMDDSDWSIDRLLSE